MIGGRIGYSLFYKPGYYLEHPLEIVQVWKAACRFTAACLA